jgi:hypothetical protein
MKFLYPKQGVSRIVVVVLLVGLLTGLLLVTVQNLRDSITGVLDVERELLLLHCLR